MKSYPQDASIVAVVGVSWFGRLLENFQTEGADKGDASHIAMAFIMTPERKAFLIGEMGLDESTLPKRGICIIEAHYIVRVTAWEEFAAMRKAKGDALKIITWTGLSAEGANRIVRHVLTYAGEPYSITRLLAMGLKRLTGIRFDLHMRGDRPVCSYLAAKPYFVEGGIRFEGSSYKACTPDNIVDHTKVHDDWLLMDV